MMRPEVLQQKSVCVRLKFVESGFLSASAPLRMQTLLQQLTQMRLLYCNMHTSRNQFTFEIWALMVKNCV